ncbi:MAG: formylglycine-generating enzyme family protein [Phycisphaeraceae bacterium]|nr:formylglycine-generating enzyme family protein [Phycisphaeraceae bacterium]
MVPLLLAAPMLAQPPSSPPPARPAPEKLASLVWIPGGEFDMGSTDPLARRDEAPIHRVRVDGFWISPTEVTNSQFANFVEATGYTTTAERAVDWEQLRQQVAPGTPKPPDDMLRPGSLVFVPPPGQPGESCADLSWWQWTIGADWRHPEGPASDITDRMDHPVVQVSYEDALAYCAWAGGRLPTEAEWEFAARGGLKDAVNPWGNEPIGPTRANTWQGSFPRVNSHEDGFVRTAPVASYPPNGYGLYDMAGNVWEWTSDLFRDDTYALMARSLGPDGVAANPKGPPASHDPRNPHAPDVRVQRGGSFLCNDSYCASYRVSARMGCTPDTGMSHVGIRLVRDAEAPKPTAPAQPIAPPAAVTPPASDH